PRCAAGCRRWSPASACPGDPELAARIARHRSERPADWPTIEVGADLAAALGDTEPNETVLIAGFTLVLSALLGDDAAPIDPILDGPVADALRAIDERPGPVIVVSDEIG